MHLVDFSLLTKDEVVMLSGEPRGVAAREEFLPSSISDDQEIKVVAPEDLVTITPSFVQGFFSQRMDAVGLEAFEKNLDMSSLPVHLQKDIRDGLDKLRYRRLHPRGNS